MGPNGGWYWFVTVIMFVAVIGIPHRDPLLSVFVGLQQEEVRFIKNTKNVCNSPLLQIEERKNVL